MSRANEIEQLLTEVSSTFGLTRAAKRDLFEYWQSNLEESSLNFSRIIMSSDIRQRIIELARNWIDIQEQRGLPARVRARSSQIFLFETVVKFLLIQHQRLRSTEETIETFDFFDETHLLFPGRRMVLHGFQRRKIAEPHLSGRVRWVTGPPTTETIDDEDAEIRVILNQISASIESASKDLATSNDRMEQILSRMEMAEAKDTKLEISGDGDHGSTQGNP